MPATSAGFRRNKDAQPGAARVDLAGCFVWAPSAIDCRPGANIRRISIGRCAARPTAPISLRTNCRSRATRHGLIQRLFRCKSARILSRTKSRNCMRIERIAQAYADPRERNILRTHCSCGRLSRHLSSADCIRYPCPARTRYRTSSRPSPKRHLETPSNRPYN